MIRTNSIKGEYYHVYNRGVDKRVIFSDRKDYERFLKSLTSFNTLEPIGSIYEHSFEIKKNKVRDKLLVKIICYCLNPNHFHLLLTPVIDGGVEKFMQRLGTGYTMYFNERYKRSGALFQGRYKSKHVADNDYLLYLSAYINLNHKVHQLGGSTSKSSWQEYISGTAGKIISDKKVILDQFKNQAEYKSFAEETVEDIVDQRLEDKILGDLLLE